MEQWIVQVMQSAGQWGFLIILLLMAAENIFPPIPSEVVLTCAGFLTTCSELTRFQAILSATLGSLLGAVVLYGLGRALPVEKLSHLGFQPEEIEDAERWFCKRGKIAVLLCRCVPMVRSLISIPAGTARDADAAVFAADRHRDGGLGHGADRHRRGGGQLLAAGGGKG